MKFSQFVSKGKTKQLRKFHGNRRGGMTLKIKVEVFPCFPYGRQILPPLTTLRNGHENINQTSNYSEPLRPNTLPKFMQVGFGLALTLSQVPSCFQFSALALKLRPKEEI